MMRPLVAAALMLFVLLPAPCTWAAKLESVPAPVPLASPNLLPEPSGKPGEIVLRIEDCVRKAIADATSVLKAEYDDRYSGAQLLQAYGQFLPNLTASANTAYSTGQTYSTAGNPAYVVGSGNTSSYSIQTGLNLFNGLSDYAYLKSSLLKKNASDLTVYRAKQQIKLDILQSFYQVVLDHRLTDIATANLKTSLERERVFKGQVEVGTRHLSDLFRQQAETASDEYQLLSARNKMLADQLALLRKLRIDVVNGYRFLEPVMLGEKDMPPVRDEKTLLEVGLKQRVDLKASVETADADQWDVRTAWGGYLPKLNLLAGLSSGGSYVDSHSVNGGAAVPVIQNNIPYQLGSQLEFSIGLNLTWTIFDRFLTHQATSRAQAVADGADLDMRDQKNRVQADVRQAYGDYVTVLQQLRATNLGLVAGQKAYDVLAGRYTVGGVNLLDLLTQQQVLVQAQSQQAQALIAFQLQDAALRFATGEMTVE